MKSGPIGFIPSKFTARALYNLFPSITSSDKLEYDVALNIKKAPSGSIPPIRPNPKSLKLFFMIFKFEYNNNDYNYCFVTLWLLKNVKQKQTYYNE